MTYDTHHRLMDSIKKIKNGDLRERDNFLDEYKPFIWKVAFSLCKKKLTWGVDDELSIALIGFNDSLDSYDLDKNVPFLSYSRVVIQNRLKDYFRKQSKTGKEYPLELEDSEGYVFNPGDNKAAWENYQNLTIEEERQQELEQYERLLAKFDIDFEDLVTVSPKHRDSRDTLVNVAKTIASAPEFMQHLLTKKQLPLNQLISKTGVNRKTLERGRKFIISTALILYYCEDFIYLKSYINDLN